MKRIFYLLPFLLLFAACNQQPQISSPNGQVTLTFRVNKSGVPQYSVSKNNTTLILWSSLGLACAEQDLTSGFEITDTESQFFSDKWETVWGEERVIEDRHYEMRVALLHQSGVRMDVLFRVFDDGIAFR